MSMEDDKTHEIKVKNQVMGYCRQAKAQQTSRTTVNTVHMLTKMPA
jgi:hypothetical protein